ncbi:Uncharacterized protein FWK35_00019276 [Aphis craccivora]|uniref:Uncharacterized protein n=1 Tax=Aphis craccivora TaxID=307492 RepID=A0A6G0Y0Z3_APHCR|nr:Uncharacterized protein FWK35_00019276 [Aphis craccivora]
MKLESPQNEGDSMHARIENEGNKILKGGPIFEPSQWNEDGEKLFWNSFKVIKIDKMNPLMMKYKISYSQDSFKIVNNRQKKRKSLNLIPGIKILDTPAKISNEKRIFYHFAKVDSIKKYLMVVGGAGAVDVDVGVVMPAYNPQKSLLENVTYAK